LGITITSLADLRPVSEMASKPTFLIPDLLAEGSLTLICSESGSGKTYFTYFLAGAIAHAREVLGVQALQRPVYYFDGENPDFIVSERLADMGISDAPPLHIWGQWYENDPPAPDDPMVVELVNSGVRPVLIWDSLVEFNTGDESSATEMRRYMKKFKRLARLGATIIILHHTGKSNTSKEYRGSSDIKGVVDMAFTLSCTQLTPTGALGKLKLVPFKRRAFLAQPLYMRYTPGVGFERDTGTTFADVRLDVVPEPDMDAVAEAVRAIVHANPGSNQTFLVLEGGKLGHSKYEVLEALEDRSVFELRRGPRNAKLYWLRAGEEDMAA
jgi:hypothetical protein